MSKVLVVVDMQNDFVTGSLGTKEAQAIVPNVINKVKEYVKRNLFIYTTQDTHESNYLETLEGLCLPVEHCIVNTDGWELIPELKSVFNLELNPDFVMKYTKLFSLEKETFGSNDLVNMLKRHHLEVNEITEIEVIGVCTDICVVSNVMLIRAMFPNIPITVDASCCAGVTPQSHLKALDVMKMCQINVINEANTTEDFKSAFVAYDVMLDGTLFASGDVVVTLADGNKISTLEDIEVIKNSIKEKFGNPENSVIHIKSIQKLPLF